MTSTGLDLLAAAGTALAYGAGPSVPWARIVLSLLFCIAVAVAAIAFLRWRSGRTPLSPVALLMRRTDRAMPQLELIERLPLSAASQLCLVRCDAERYLILVSPAGAQLVERLAAAEDAGP